MTINRKSFNRAANGSAILTSLMDGNAVDASAVNAAIKSIGTAGRKLDTQIHGTAVACIYLSMSVAEGGPATGAKPAIDLLNALPKGTRAEKLAKWFATYSNVRVRWDKKAKAFTGGVLGADAKGYAVPRPNEAMDKPFFDLGKDERESVDFTTDMMAKRVAALLTAAKADNAKLDAKGKAALADLEKLAAKLEKA